MLQSPKSSICGSDSLASLPMKKLTLARLKSALGAGTEAKFVANVVWNESAGQTTTFGVLNSLDITWNTLPWKGCWRPGPDGLTKAVPFWL